MMNETGKRRKSRIELGYYRAPDQMLRLRRWLWRIAIVVAAAWLVAARFADRKETSHLWSLVPTRIASKGPLAQPHALWDSKCEVCHENFVPINGSRWAPTPWSGSKAGDEKCKNCHPGPAHHQSELEVTACAECHRDHQGRNAWLLLAVDDSSCTKCHQDLTNHRKTDAAGSIIVAGKGRKGENVSKFDQAHHPDLTDSWKARSSDPRRVKFNHALHLAAGLTLEKEGKPFTFGKLSPADRIRYAGDDEKKTDAPIKLECASCHQSDLDEHTRSKNPRVPDTGAPRTHGAYMLPIVYENHCAACHTLQFEEKREQQFARHGISASETLDNLKQLYMSEVPKDDPKLLEEFVPPREVPGRALRRGEQVKREAVEAKVLIAAKILFGAAVENEILRKEKLPLGRRGCVECHNLKPGAKAIVDTSSLASIEIDPPLMTPVWQNHAAFDHWSHSALKCIECHDKVTTSTANGGDQPLLPTIETCVKCHAPAGNQSAEPAGASTACVECHRYHNGDNPQQGLGARARRGKPDLAIEQFLRGVP
jgi:predicted CXXCH cytochrome family protein